MNTTKQEQRIKTANDAGQNLRVEPSPDYNRVLVFSGLKGLWRPDATGCGPVGFDQLRVQISYCDSRAQDGGYLPTTHMAITLDGIIIPAIQRALGDRGHIFCEADGSWLSYIERVPVPESGYCYPQRFMFDVKQAMTFSRAEAMRLLEGESTVYRFVSEAELAAAPGDYDIPHPDAAEDHEPHARCNCLKCDFAQAVSEGRAALEAGAVMVHETGKPTREPMKDALLALVTLLEQNADAIRFVYSHKEVPNG